MVRNWQARVEQADVRRKQAKQKKQLSEDKKLWKQWVHDCIKTQLDQNSQQIQKLVPNNSLNHAAASVATSGMVDASKQLHATLTLQIWTDTKPTGTTTSSRGKNSISHEDVDDFENGSMKKNHRAKSKSFGADQDIDNEENEGNVTPRGNKKEQRNRSNSTGGANGGTGGNASSNKKKAHPRSKEAMVSTEQLSATTARRDDDDVSMCRSYFFTGNCPLMKKKNSCRFTHPNHSNDSQNQTNRTLHDALTTTPRTTTLVVGSTTDPESQLQKSARAEIIAAERAATITTTIAAAAATTTTKSLSSPSSTAASATTTGSASDGAPLAAIATVDPIVVVGAMNMVYYIEVPIVFDIVDEGDNENGMLPSEQISNAFVLRNLFLGNTVYMAVNGILIFDRYQDGMIYRSEEFLQIIFGEEAVDNVVLCNRDRYSMNPQDIATLVHMPAILLEHICSYLVVESIVSMTQVCRAWYNEIGLPNAPMWKILLNRHDWPYNDDNNVTDTRKCSYRWQFHQHYLFMRDVQALKTVFDAFVTRRNNNGSYTISNPAVAIYDYVSRRNIPDGPCVGIEVWSPRRALLAYQLDCTLRLFESSHKIAAAGEYTNEKHCRELICYRINPYRKTKRKSCVVQKLVLDDKFITTLCSVGESSHLPNKEILVTISRDDFLLGESDAVDNEMSSETRSTNPLHVFPLTETILQYMLTKTDDRPQAFDDLDEDILSYFTTRSSSVSPCRPGHLLITTHMSLQQPDDNAVLFLDARLFIISTTTREIVWSNNCYPVYDEIPVSNFLHDNIIGSNATYRHRHLGGSQSKALCNFAVVSGGVNGTAMVGELDSSGTVCAFENMPALPWPIDEVESGRFLERDPFSRRNLVLTSDVIVTTDAWITYRSDGSWMSNCTFVSFYPKCCFASSMNKSEGNSLSEASFLKISDNLIAHHVSCVRNEYLVIMCEVVPEVPSFHPFMDGRATSVLVHIPSRKEIGRLSWKFEGLDLEHELEFLPIFASNEEGTLVMESMQMGVILTGDDVRYLDNDDVKMDPQQLELMTRKKKKKPVRSKKDSFRTHNGDRCY